MQANSTPTERFSECLLATGMDFSKAAVQTHIAFSQNLNFQVPSSHVALGSCLCACCMTELCLHIAGNARSGESQLAKHRLVLLSSLRSVRGMGIWSAWMIYVILFPCLTIGHYSLEPPKPNPLPELVYGFASSGVFLRSLA